MSGRNKAIRETVEEVMDRRKKLFSEKWYFNASGYVLAILAAVVTLTVWGKNVEKKDVSQDERISALEKMAEKYEQGQRDIINRLQDLGDRLPRKGK